MEGNARRGPDGFTVAIIALIVVVVALVVVFVLAGRGPVVTSSNGHVTNKGTAQAQCKDSIKRELISPATAKFRRIQTLKSDDTWHTYVTLDSQNGFGALLRSEWACTFDGTTGKTTITPMSQ